MSTIGEVINPVTQLVPRTSLDAGREVTEFMFYHNHLILKGNNWVVVYNFTNKQRFVIDIEDEFRLALMPPHLFVAMQDQYLRVFG